MNDKEWLHELEGLRKQDEARRQAEAAQEAAEAASLETKRQAGLLILDKIHAHELLRQVQRAFLNGGGEIRFFREADAYDHAIVLSWAGPISEAVKPASPTEATGNLVIGIRSGVIEVNGVPVAENTTEAVRTLLLAACREWMARNEDGDFRL